MQQQLNNEYEKLSQLRLEQSQSLKEQWEVYKKEQKQYRRKDIESRQVEFDKELSVLDGQRRMKWKNNDSIEDLAKEEIIKRLISRIDEYENDGEDETFFSLPTDLVELFWLLEIEVPITKAELFDAKKKIT
ncbi:hypothetical protein BDF21DRAFT_426903 [Thamnidium elegans]|uniref:Uncharacterized protein n=1 Tax=Thamnidium elegans TaxID=101142 RepID=A0A8H7SKT1_9FUNG|nr:hypothetical protein INT48_007558 [Thamnidium elegans]KAI8066021.1 hypothetical protein BDF21DRAFT_426903 [Thamnidium elegans]